MTFPGGRISGDISPSNTGQDLGDVSHQWDAYIQDLHVSGPFTATTTASITGISTLTGGVKVGSGGTTFTQANIYSQTITPASTASATSVEQTFTVTGLTIADKVFINPPALANACAPVACRVTTADTLGITYMNPTAGALTSSSGTYLITAIRS